MSSDKKKPLVRRTTASLPHGGSEPPAGYGDFLVEIKAQVRQRQFQALRAANQEMLGFYWWLGENISRRQTELGWVKPWSKTWRATFKPSSPGAMGFLRRTCG